MMVFLLFCVFVLSNVQLEYYCHAMSQLALCVKADMTGTKPIGKAVLMFGCKRLFDDAYKFFNICGVKDYTLRAKILAYLCKCKGYLYQNDSAKEKMESTGRGAGLCVGLCDEVKVIPFEILLPIENGTDSDYQW